MSEEVNNIKTFRNTLYHLTDEDTSIIQVIKEMKDNMCDLLNDEEQNDFMDFLCSKWHLYLFKFYIIVISYANWHSFNVIYLLLQVEVY